MSANPVPHFSLEEYAAVERAGEARYEYWDGEIVCMSGGSPEHNRLSARIFQRLANHVENRPGRKCEAFTSDQAVRTDAGKPYRYPDASVVCGQARFATVLGTSTLTNPTLLVEVTSSTSEKRDREHKFKIYRKIRSLKEYLIVFQDRPCAVVHTRTSAGRWKSTMVADLDATVFLSSIGCDLDLRDLYRGIEFPATETHS